MIIRLKRILFNIRRILILRLNEIRIRNKIYLENKNLKIVLHEKYRKAIGISRVLLTLIGLFSAFIIFESTIIAFFFGLVIFVFTWIIEKTSFNYAKEFMHEFNPEIIANNRWQAVCFGYVENPDTFQQIPLIGMVCEDNEFANTIHDQILQWSDYQYNDVNKLVSMSAITNKNYYRFFCCPNLKSEKVNKHTEDYRAELRKTSLTDEFVLLQGSLFLEKKCEITSTSLFPSFKKRFRNGTPVAFEVYYTDDKGQLHRASKQKESFWIHTFSIKDKSELTRKDIEYDIVKYLRED